MSVIYRQYDSRWGNLSYPEGNTMAGSGCGPTSCANVIANLSNSSITPKDTRSFMLKHGYAVRNAGTAWAGIPACLQNWGFTVKSCPNMATVWAECAKGNEQGIILFTAGTKGGVTWTTDGHFVAFTDYRIENGKHWFYTRDSGPRKNDGWHCYETTMQGLIPAIWTCTPPKVTCSITYNGNGGVNMPSRQTYTYATSGRTTLSSTVPTKKNYTFLGWSLNKNATSASYQPGQGWNLSNRGDYILYAVWRGNKVTINYNANKGSNAPASQTYYYATSGTTKLSSKLPNRDGFKCLGWAIDKNATTAAYKAGQEWQLHNSGPTYTLYAVWKRADVHIPTPYPGPFPTGIISKGSTGSNVKYLQAFLNWYSGRNVLDVDGICGDATIAKLKAFQKNCKLEADGVCGEKTIAAMKAVRK